MIVVFISSFLFSLSPKQLKVIFLDVGQGDSILIQTPNHKTILIDGGPDESAVRKLSQYLPWWQKSIDFVFLTHAHDDHSTGLLSISQHYSFKNLIYEKEYCKTATCKNLNEIGQKQKSTIWSPEKISTLNLGPNCKLQILKINRAEKETLNNRSLITYLDCLGTKILFLGDLEKKKETELLANYPELQINILKVAHHGSKTSTSENILKQFKPNLAVISVGKNNKFNHPYPETLSLLIKNHLKIYRTDENGDIEINGTKSKFYYLKTEKLNP
jgi:competence protein ComEC